MLSCLASVWTSEPSSAANANAAKPRARRETSAIRFMKTSLKTTSTSRDLLRLRNLGQESRRADAKAADHLRGVADAGVDPLDAALRQIEDRSGRGRGSARHEDRDDAVRRRLDDESEHGVVVEFCQRHLELRRLPRRPGRLVLEHALWRNPA